MSLASKSMFVSLSQRLWHAARADRSLAIGVEKNTRAEYRSMNVTKKLVPKEVMLPIRRLVRYGREQHERMTLPGLEEGKQLLATKMFDEYAQTQAMIKEKFFAEVDKFCDSYPEIVRTAPERLQKAYRAEDFPPINKIRSYFDYEIRFSPVPDTGNWLLEGVDDEALDRLRNEVDNEKNAMFREATKKLYARASKVLENLAKQAEHYDEHSAGLRAPTLEAVKDMSALLIEMNITADPVLEAAGKEMMERFGDLQSKELQKDAKSRKEVFKAASALLKKLKQTA